MSTPSLASTARQSQLARAARVAGEAFAFVDQDEDASTRLLGSRPLVLVLAWLTLGLMAATVLLQLT